MVKLGVIGPGLIGRSVTLAARRAWPSIDVVEVDREQPLDALVGADVIVVATPIDTILDIIANDASRFTGSLIVDTGSTKRAILDAARAANLTTFVGGHPMAGGATTGPGAARADLFDGKPWFLIPGLNRSLLDSARSFVESLGASPVMMDDDGRDHDRLMAAVSHLPQLVASLLISVSGAAAGPPGLGHAGPGLRDTTRLAESRADIWQSIVATNAGEIAPLLRTLADQLHSCADALECDDAIRSMFETANHYHAILNGANDAT